jgi:hypothetical protein
VAVRTGRAAQQGAAADRQPVPPTEVGQSGIEWGAPERPPVAGWRQLSAQSVRRLVSESRGAMSEAEALELLDAILALPVWVFYTVAAPFALCAVYAAFAYHDVPEAATPPWLWRRLVRYRAAIRNAFRGLDSTRLTIAVLLAIGFLLVGAQLVGGPVFVVLLMIGVATLLGLLVLRWVA